VVLLAPLGLQALPLPLPLLPPIPPLPVETRLLRGVERGVDLASAADIPDGRFQRNRVAAAAAEPGNAAEVDA